MFTKGQESLKWPLYKARSPLQKRPFQKSPSREGKPSKISSQACAPLVKRHSNQEAAWPLKCCAGVPKREQEGARRSTGDSQRREQKGVAGSLGKPKKGTRGSSRKPWGFQKKERAPILVPAITARSSSASCPWDPLLNMEPLTKSYRCLR